MNSLVVFLGILIIALVVFLNTPPATLAKWIKSIIPITLIIAGAGLVFLRQAMLGSLILFAGIALWRRTRGVGHFGPASSPRNGHSHVRSAALEMELDHSSGAMNGMVLAGQHEGKELDQLSEDDLAGLRKEITNDGESLALLDAYLDRRLPGWRENGEFDPGAGQGSPSGSGPMSEQEAYEVLGLSPGAGADAIRKAHRRLMKTAHPDSGGSTFLAAKINEAKDVLLRSHS